jgi:nucleotide-binding universal stress UspA family protein
MSFVKLLALITGGAHDAATLAAAFSAAKILDAHVVALFVHTDARDAIPFGELPLSAEFVQELIDSMAEVEQASADAARSTLATMAAEAGIRLIGAPQAGEGVSVSYEELSGFPPQVVARTARLCDLAVLPALRAIAVRGMSECFANVLMKASCPVLLASETPPTSLGRRIAIGWDDGTACARALVAAVPFLEKAETVELLWVGDAPSGPGIEQAVAYLALRKIAAVARVVPRSGRKIGDTLLEATKAGGFDMLVTGGYGHARWSEAMFGGVTERVISHNALPVLMAH